MRVLFISLAYRFAKQGLAGSTHPTMLLEVLRKSYSVSEPQMGDSVLTEEVSEVSQICGSGDLLRYVTSDWSD